MQESPKADTCTYIEHIEFLSPVAESDRNKVYIEALKKAVDEESVKNIALSGPYGSGKSSVLAAYKNTEKKVKIAEVSLANFEHTGTDVAEGEQNTKDTPLQVRIEKSILQQLFFSVNKSKIPYSRLKRIYQPNLWQLLWYTTVILLWIVLGYLLSHPDICEVHISIENRSDILTGLFLLLSALILYMLIQYLSKVRLNKLVIQNNEFDLSTEDKETSLINKHIDEIIYFFEKTGCQILIIEDLDRFNSKQVFEKLREMNTIINHTKSIKQKVTFIYAVKDDFFINENRTKFFDLIIPVIPFINATGNAKHLFERKLEAIGQKNAISADLLKYVSYYVHDYRLLANIFNEFLIYLCQIRRHDETSSQEKKDNTDQPSDKSKLLAMIFYKNLFPEDFARLHKAEGVLHEVFATCKQKLVKNYIKKIKTQIKETEGEISSLRKELAENAAEIRLFCLMKLFGNNSSIAAISINGRFMSLVQIAQNESIYEKLMEQLQNSNNVIAGLISNSSTGYLNNQSIGRSTQNISECKDRLKRFGTDKFQEIENLQNKLKGLESEKNRIQNMGMSELLKKYDSSAALFDRLLNIGTIRNQKNNNETIASRKQHEVLKYLIQQGYIDESYHAYISYFHEGGSLSHVDYSYILDVLEQKESSFDREIANPQAVIEELTPNLIATRFSLNYKVICTLFEKLEDQYKAKRHSVIKLLSEDEDSAKEFLPGFVEKYAHSSCASQLIGALANEDRSFWEKVELWENNTETLLALLLKGAQKETLLRQGKALKDSVYRCKKLPLLMDEYNLEKEAIEDLLLEWKGEFKELEIYSGSDTMLNFLRFIYKNDFYVLNAEMIRLLIQNIGRFEEGFTPDDKRAIDYGIIKISGLEKLIERVDTNINTYVERIYLNHILTDKKLHSYETILDLINHRNINGENIKTIVAEMDIIIEDLSDIKECEAKSAVVFHGKLTPKWQNILPYYSECTEKIDDALKNLFCNENFVNELFRQEIPQPEPQKLLYRKLIEDLIFDDAFKIECLDRMSPHIEALETIQSDISGTKPERVKSLIDRKLLAMTPEVYEKLQEFAANTSTKVHVRLVEKNFSEFMKIISLIAVDEEEITELLKSMELGLKEKIDLINSLSDRMEANAVAEVVLDAIQEQQDFRLNIDILKTILESELEYEKKTTLLADQIKKVSGPEEAVSLIESTGGIFYDLLPNSGMETRARVPYSQKNEIILQALKTFGIIGRFRPSKDESEFIVWKKKHLSHGML